MSLLTVNITAMAEAQVLRHPLAAALQGQAGASRCAFRHGRLRRLHGRTFSEFSGDSDVGFHNRGVAKDRMDDATPYRPPILSQTSHLVASSGRVAGDVNCRLGVSLFVIRVV